VRVRSLAGLILDYGSVELSDRAVSLLTSLKAYDRVKQLTTRQLEALYALRETSIRKDKAGRYRADHLVRTTWEARLDLLYDEAEGWLDEMHVKGAGIELTRTEWRRLLALARKLDLIPPDEWIEL
jgi:Ser/Thr protein kinase RdoA (MazF antagonist)